MREIKFRAWHEVSGMKHFNLGSYEWVGSKPQLLFCDGDYRSTDECEIMQYTGLKDNNGKEIYEGDIVTWIVNGRDTTAPIIYDKGSFWMGKDIKTGFSVCNDWYRGEYEVIGTIYENPELLK